MTTTLTPSSDETIKRGLFIVLEGLDRSGKSTQVELLEKGLKEVGRRVKTMKFPDRTTPIGKMINAYLTNAQDMDDRAIHLLFSANRWEVASQIERDLKDGIDIIADRYAFSGIAFSAAKGLPIPWLLAPDLSLPSPDLTIFLTLSPSTASTRSSYGTERYETLAIQSAVRAQFERVAEEVGKRGGRSGVWVGVEADGGVEDVRRGVWEIVSGGGWLEKELGEVGRLWV